MIAPAGFEQRLLRLWPDFQALRWNDAVQRWEFVFTATTGLPVSLFYGWDRNALTGEAVEPDPISGLLPFRDLTPDAQAEIIKTGTESYLANRHDGARDWRDHIQQRMRFNRDIKAHNWAERGKQYADMIAEVDLRRPWVKHHVRKRPNDVKRHVDAGNLVRIQVVSR